MEREYKAASLDSELRFVFPGTSWTWQKGGSGIGQLIEISLRFSFLSEENHRFNWFSREWFMTKKNRLICSTVKIFCTYLSIMHFQKFEISSRYDVWSEYSCNFFKVLDFSHSATRSLSRINQFLRHIISNQLTWLRNICSGPGSIWKTGIHSDRVSSTLMQNSSREFCSNRREVNKKQNWHQKPYSHTLVHVIGLCYWHPVLYYLPRVPW